MDPQQAAESSPTSPTSPSTPISPPFWHSEGQELPPPADISSRKPRSSGIQLEDHTHEDSEHSKACWARSVAIRDHVVVGSGLGTYVVYNCVVETANGSHITVRKRYSEFDILRANLLHTFPNSEAALPKLPPKSAFVRFERRFLDKRRHGLQYFLNCVLLNPEFSASPVLKDFLFS